MTKQLEKIAMKHPQVESGTSCNKVSYKACNKAFLYVGQKADSYNVMLKLNESLGEAELLARKNPDQYHVGLNGWVKIEMDQDQSPPKGVWERWIDESFRLIVPSKIVDAMATGTGVKKTKTKPKSSAKIRGKTVKAAKKKKATHNRATTKKKPPSRKPAATKQGSRKKKTK